MKSQELKAELILIRRHIFRLENIVMASVQDIKDAQADEAAAIKANTAATTGLAGVVAALVKKIEDLKASGGATAAELDGLLVGIQANTAAIQADTAAEGAAAAAAGQVP